MVKMQCDGITKKGEPCQRWVTYNGWNMVDGGLYCSSHRESSLDFIEEPTQNADPKSIFLEDMFFLLITLVCSFAIISLIVVPWETVSLCGIVFLLLIIVSQIGLFDKT